MTLRSGPSLFALVALALLLAPPVRAHAGHTSYCAAHSVVGGLQVTFEAPLGLAQQTSEPARDLEGHVRASTPLGECALATRGPSPSDRPGSVHFNLDFSCPDGPITFSTDYGMNLEQSAEVVCSLDGAPHVFRQGALDYAVGTPPTLFGQVTSFIKLGAWHVFTGLDHVLFVLTLLLGAANGASSSAKRAFARVVSVVTGFTLGHSLTLLLATFGIWRLPAALSESLIALSIALVAVHNLFADNPRGRVLLSAGFGLIHGFGFASALAQLGLPRRGTLGALLAFNVGIELSQLLIVLACFPLLVWARHRPWFRARLLLPASCLIAGLASVWFIKRAFASSLLPWLGG